jgi:hypothetical protein
MEGMLLFDGYLRVSFFLRTDISLAVVSSSASHNDERSMSCHSLDPTLRPHLLLVRSSRQRHVRSIILVIFSCLAQKAAITSATLSRRPHQGFQTLSQGSRRTSRSEWEGQVQICILLFDLAPKATPTLRLKKAHTAKSGTGAVGSPGEVRCRSKAVFPAIVAGEQMVDLFGDAGSAQLPSKPGVV